MCQKLSMKWTPDSEVSDVFYLCLNQPFTNQLSRTQKSWLPIPDAATTKDSKTKISENPGYNQPSNNYRSFPQQNRRDQLLAVLDKNWYDDEFVTRFRQSLSEQSYSGSDLERISTQQENVQVLSHDIFVLLKQQSQDAINLEDSWEMKDPWQWASNLLCPLYWICSGRWWWCEQWYWKH